MTRGQALRFGALLHDIAKPATRAVSRRGAGDVHGTRRASASSSRRDVLRRLRASERLIALRPGARPPPSDARVPRPRRAALPARRLPLPGRVRAGRGGRHRAQRRRPARDARATVRAGDRAASRARARGDAGCAALASAAAAAADPRRPARPRARARAGAAARAAARRARARPPSPGRSPARRRRSTAPASCSVPDRRPIEDRRHDQR